MMETGGDTCIDTNCEVGFFFHDTDQVCMACIDNCLHCSDSTTCDECDEGYVVSNADATCMSTACNDGFYFDY